MTCRSLTQTMALLLVTTARFSGPQTPELPGLVKQAMQQITLTGSLSPMLIPGRLLEETALFSERRMAGAIGPIRPVPFHLTFTTFLLQMQIPARLSVLSV